MKIAVWKTGHQIADTVADALVDGVRNCKSQHIECYNNLAAMGDYAWPEAYIGYGILRHNTFEIATRYNKPYFEIDRGYFNPGHFDGYYRISYKGTQAKWHDDIPQSDICPELEPWRKPPEKGYVLIVPPTDAVIDFFGINYSQWLTEASKSCGYYGSSIRYKDEQRPIEWDKLAGVVTFNSSIGWQALQKGIPCISNSEHSLVGSYYNQNLVDYNFESVKSIPREPLFKSMLAHQFTLNEMRAGKAWTLINHYLNTKPQAYQNTK